MHCDIGLQDGNHVLRLPNSFRQSIFAYSTTFSPAVLADLLISWVTNVKMVPV